MRVEVVPYDPRWPDQFAALRAELAAALAAVPVLAIEHVGSTAVPGLPAKPILDVDVVVEAPDVSAAVDALTAAGYESLGDLGVPDRHAFRAPTAGVRRNVYVAVAGCLSLRNHLGVRDVLRVDAERRAEYGALKLRLSGRDYETFDGYVTDKSAVLQRVLRQAGLDAAELAAVAAANRPAPA